MLILRLFYLLGLTFSANSIRRTYYLAAVEIDWDYGNAENRELVPFRKSVFRQFSDGYYRREIPHVESLGYFGPTLIAEVGDALVVRLRNFATVSCNLQAQGVKVTSENPSYVLPHNQSTYQWEIPQESSPTYDDPPCVARLYYSSVDQIKDINSGLVGSLIICKPGWIWTVEEETPKVLVFAISVESKSLFHHNHVVNNTHHHNEVSSLHYTINGFSFKTFPALSTCSGESTTLFLIGLSAKSTSFSITFENHVIQMRSFHVTNVVSLFTGSTEVIEITPHQDIQVVLVSTALLMNIT
nr:coagulation factor V-like [Ciona intestinalis]|eukprot:XP_009857487.1 coagulation factor V-like [Ciona intestinalis]